MTRRMLKKSECTPIEWAAIRWWQGHRPYDWDLKKHLENPAVNMSGGRERDIAAAIAAAIRRAGKEKGNV